MEIGMNNKLYKLMNWPGIEEIIYSESDNPHGLLGPHRVGSQILLQAFFPGAGQVKVQLLTDMREIAMELADEEGFFAQLIPARDFGPYRYVVTDGEGEQRLVQDAYCHEPVITREDTEKFSAGIHYTVYDKLGAHPCVLDGQEGTLFALWAPNALRVSVVGDFNGWDGRVHQMRRLWDSGIFELFVPGAAVGDCYKYELKLKGGLTYLKADPYADAAQKRPDTASVIADLTGFVWEDQEFVQNRSRFQAPDQPLSVYEVYLGSLAQAQEGEEYAGYRRIAPRLIEYVKEMGYTHVELLPVMEHSSDASLGYQITGYYAPTARYGSPEDFMYFVNELHKAGIGVILDWSAAYFPGDGYGLSNFDGTCLYEHRDPRQGVHPYLGTLLYNYGRPQVSNFLIASALFWVEKYHADGIRMDSVAGMLYLDYGKGQGQWIPNLYGGRENLDAIELIKHLNSILKKRNPGVLTVADESGAYPMATGALEEGGLGFDLMWNQGYVNDYLGYIRYDPFFRSHHHGELTFSMIYAYSESFMLAFSHREVAGGRSGLVERMPGTRREKFANLRLSYGYGMTHPGKKLLFMGQELAEPEGWNERRTVSWELMKTPEHAGMAALCRDLNRLYRKEKALYELDRQPEGFQWMNAISGNDCYVSFVRQGRSPEELLLVAANFAGIPQTIRTGVPREGKYKEILNTDDIRYGGEGITNPRAKRAQEKEWDDRRFSVSVELGALSLSILKFVPYTQEELEGIRARQAERERKAAQRAAQAQAGKASGETRARAGKASGETRAQAGKSKGETLARAEKSSGAAQVQAGKASGETSVQAGQTGQKAAAPAPRTSSARRPRSTGGNEEKQ